MIKNFTPPNWMKHWMNGGTGITRTDDDKDGLYAQIAESVKQFGDSRIWMENNNLELHSSLQNLSKFWKFHDERVGSN